MRQALELALKALEEFGEHYNWCHQFPTYASPEEYPPCNCGYDKTITAIKEALAQPEEEKLHPVHIGVDVTREGTAVTAFYRKPDAVMEMFYSQFHPLAQPEQEPCEYCKRGLKTMCLCGIKPKPKEPEQEPVAWWIPKAEQFCLPSSDGTRPFAKAWEPLYATPPQRKWVGLTQDELNMIGDSMRTWNSWTITDVYFAIEAKLKEKNT